MAAKLTPLKKRGFTAPLASERATLGERGITPSIESSWIVSPGQVFVLLLICAGALFAMGLIALIWIYHFGAGALESIFLRKFDVISDQSLPTMFNAMVFQLCAGLSFWAGMISRKTSKPFVLQWLVLSLVFLFLSIDDLLMFHEAVGYVIGVKLSPAERLGGAFYYAWVIPAVPIVLILTLFMLRWFLHLPVRSRSLGALAALLFLAGAIGLEMFSSAVDYQRGAASVLTLSTSFVEEALETIGPIIFVYVLLDYLRRDDARLRIGFSA